MSKKPAIKVLHGAEIGTGMLPGGENDEKIYVLMSLDTGDGKTDVVMTLQQAKMIEEMLHEITYDKNIDLSEYEIERIDLTGANQTR